MRPLGSPQVPGKFGRGRYLVPMIAATPATMLAVTPGLPELRLLWIGVVLVLWSYAGIMVYAQSIGIARRGPTSA